MATYYDGLPDALRNHVYELLKKGEPALAQTVTENYYRAQRVEKLEKMVAYYRWLNSGTMDDEDFDKVFGT